MNRMVLLQLFEMKGNSGDDSESEDFCLGTLFEEIEDLSEVSPNLKIQMAFAYMVWSLFLSVVQGVPTGFGRLNWAKQP